LKNIAVTGATGHLGNLIVRELLARGYVVKALARGNDLRAVEGLPIEIIKGDLADQSALQKLMEGCDGLIHSAALISIAGSKGGLVHKVNVEGTKLVMEIAKASGIKRVIHISSIHAFNQSPTQERLDETRALVDDRCFAYDRSKRDSQQIALSYASDQMEVLAMCPTSIMGPFDFKPSKLGNAIIQMCSGKLPFVFKGGFDFCDGRDVANAVVNGLQMGRSGHAYILGGSWADLKDLYSMVTEAGGKKRNPFVINPYLAYTGIPFILLASRITGKEPLYTHEAIVAVTEGNRFIIIDKSRTELKYNPRPLKDTVMDTCTWFSKNGYLG
jgi:nucleoside-diphosphate-sugar epimerase